MTIYIKRILRYWKTRGEIAEVKEQLANQIRVTYASSRAVTDMFHDMVAYIGIDEMERLLIQARLSGDKYVSLTTWYMETLQSRKNAYDRSRGLQGSMAKPL